MASPIITCIICHTSSDKVLLFTEQTLKKCCNVLQIRRDNNLKYSDIILPPGDSVINGYHTKCYRSFVAVMAKYYAKINIVSEEKSTTSEASTSVGSIIHDEGREVPDNMQPSSSSVENPVGNVECSENRDTVCFLCKKKKKKYKGGMEILHTGKKNSLEAIIRAYSAATEDTDIIIQFENLTTNEISYHNSCRTFYFNKGKPLLEPKPIESSWHRTRNYHKLAYVELCAFLEEKVVVKEQCFFLTFLHNYYTDSLQRLAKENSDSYDNVFTAQYLESKIIHSFENTIKIISIRHKKVIVPIQRQVFDDLAFSLLEETEILQKAAFILRNEVLKIKRKELPHCISAENLIQGECSIPQRLNDFYLSLVGGSDQRRRSSSDCMRTVKSLSEDVIYAVSNGKIKTSKHIALGMSLKSLTSSRKIVDIINRYGHCCSYHVIEELETEATFSSTARSNICPSGIKLSPDLFTGVAFDNFDRFVETTSGKDTLHDTVGIIYQNVGVSDDTETHSIEDTQIIGTSKGKRRRTFNAVTTELVPYAKKAKMVEVLAPIDDQRRRLLPTNVESIKEIDTIWMLSHALQVPNTPMWVGFNSLILQDNTHKQKVSYLTPINLSPTNTSVVLETILQSQRIADELKQPYIQVTYDLAIAKIALQIQATDKPTFNNVFIHLGAFHISMAYFKAVGKYISDCGLSSILIESELLASGSVNGFIEGKHFNRCKRLHPLMALALEILHFEAFLEHEKLEITDDLHAELVQFQTRKLSHPVTENKALSTLIQKYTAYQEATMDGKFGKTAQYYMIYINLVHHYLTLSRSIRMGDFSIFKYILPNISNLFFVLNQPNYARWLVKYHDNLVKVADTHPGLEKDFHKGYFGVKRTDKSFSRQPIDLTLEQTINADAARRLTGVVNFTNSIFARQRWSKSHDIRSTVISHVYEETGLRKCQDITADLENFQIKRNTTHLQKFIATFKKFINPFNPDLDNDYLFNIYTGKAATKPVEDFLLNIEKTGNELREIFILECASDPVRFEKPIKRTKILNFSTEGVKKKMKIGNTVQEVRMQRDLFGRMLGVSMEHNVDIAKILTYPVTPVPMSMCHLDGSLCQTDKSALVKIVEQSVDSQAPNDIDVLVLDGFFILHLMKDVPRTFGNISKKILQTVTKSNASRIDVVFDQYFSLSIKEYTRSQRQGHNLDYTISGPDQPRPLDFIKELRNNKFKEALVNFFIMHWGTNEMAPFIGNKIINLSFKKCHSFKMENGIVVTSINETLSCENHEEADTKIVHHICTIDYDANVVIRSSDTDVLVIMLGNMEHLRHDSIRIWMEIGVGNHQRHIDVTQLYVTLGPSLSSSLPGFHATTGCDYNPAFYKKGKVRPFKLLQKSPEYQAAFSALGDLHLLDSRKKVFLVLEKFICDMYNVTRLNNINEARFQIFSNTYKAKSLHESFDKKFRNYDATSLPPCQAELFQHFLRAHYITSVWRYAHLKNPTSLLPEENGWTESDGKLQFVWFEGQQLPSLVSDAIQPSQFQNKPEDMAENAEEEEEENEEDSEEDEPEYGYDSN